jgi:hypothetical protein
VLDLTHTIVYVRFAPESRQMADVSVRPLCADAVEKVANDLRERFHLAF